MGNLNLLEEYGDLMTQWFFHEWAWKIKWLIALNWVKDYVI
jgi:hypothetical protein